MQSVGFGTVSSKWVEVRQVMGKVKYSTHGSNITKGGDSGASVGGDSRGNEYIHLAKVEDSHKEVMKH